jgi:signal transduction histidine kinase
VYEIIQLLTKRITITGFLLLTVLPLFSQDTRLDSLTDLLSSRKGADKYEVLIQLMQEHYRVNRYEEALKFAREAYNVALQIGDSSKIARGGRSQGVLLVKLERTLEASEILARTLPIARRNNLTTEYQAILSNLGIAYTFQARYDEALKIHFETLQLRERDKDYVGTNYTLNNIGLVYFKLKNYPKALEFYHRALALRAHTNNEGVERILINIALCYNQLKSFQEAGQFFDEAFKFCGANCSPNILVEGKFGLGVANYGLKDYDKAEAFFKESLAIARETNNLRFQAENLVYLAHIAVTLKNFEAAKKALSESEKIAKAESYNELLIETFKEFANVYSKSNDFEAASRYQQRYIHLKDSIYSERLIDNIAKVQTQYAERENIKTIADNQAVIRQQRYLNIAIAIIAILAGLLILVLQRSNRVSKQVNAQLSEAKETIQQQNKLLEIKNKDLDREVEKKTADLERVNISLKQVNDELDNFIYKTSHDIRGPLASLKGMCNVALMDVTDEVALDYLRKLDATAERLNSILTRLLIINQINNSKLSLNRIDFNRIINDIILLEKKKGLPSKIEIRKKIADDPEIFIQSDRELVRIVLENLIDNAIKFYNDSDRVRSFVEINIVNTSEGVKARVIDNGIGISESNPGKLFQMFFRASERSEIGGIGLYIVKTATAKIGGKVGLLTTPEGYTEFYVLFPAQAPSGDTWSALQSAASTVSASNPFV